MWEGRSSAHGEGGHHINPLLIVLSCINGFRQVQKSVTHTWLARLLVTWGVALWWLGQLMRIAKLFQGITEK